MLAVIAQLLVYMSFLPNEDDISKKLPPLDDDKRETAAGFRWRVVGLLTLTMGLQKIMYGFDEGQIIRALLLGMLKALSWSFILQTVRHCVCTYPVRPKMTILRRDDVFRGVSLPQYIRLLSSRPAIHLRNPQTLVLCSTW